MRLKMKKNVVALFLSLLLVFAAAGGVQAYTDLLAFGDSLSDNGNADGFGLDTFTNGKVWVEYMAEDLGVSLIDMAYGGAVSGKNDPIAYSMTGNEFFEEAAGLQWQVDTFLNPYVYGSKDISGSLITMTAGGNDYFNLVAAEAGSAYSDQAEIDYNNGLYKPGAVAGHVATAVEKLIKAGGKNFLLQNIAMFDDKGIELEWSEDFNEALDNALAGLCAEYAYVNITILDMVGFMPEGFDYLGTVQGGSSVNPAWWDEVGIHPSTDMHREIADYALSQVNPVPEPASIMLLMTGLIGFVGAKRRKK